MFAANTSYISTPEATDGPYYVWGEMIRKNVQEDQYCDGVDIYLEIQYLDINACELVPNVYVDIGTTGTQAGPCRIRKYFVEG